MATASPPPQPSVVTFKKCLIARCTWISSSYSGTVPDYVNEQIALHLKRAHPNWEVDTTTGVSQ